MAPSSRHPLLCTRAAEAENSAARVNVFWRWRSPECLLSEARDVRINCLYDRCQKIDVIIPWVRERPPHDDPTYTHQKNN